MNNTAKYTVIIWVVSLLVTCSDGLASNQENYDHEASARNGFKLNRHLDQYYDPGYTSSVVIGYDVTKKHKTGYLAYKDEETQEWVFEFYVEVKSEWNLILKMDGQGALPEVSFPDIDRDGVSEVLVQQQMFRTIYDLYSFDVTTQAMTHLGKYPYLFSTLDTPGFFYEYRPSGCADAAWKTSLYELREGDVHLLAVFQNMSCKKNDTDFFLHGRAEKVTFLATPLGRRSKFDDLKANWNRLSKLLSQTQEE